MKAILICGGFILSVAAGAAGADPQPVPVLGATEAARLDTFRGVHPRLFLDAARRDALRAAITTTHAALWAQVQASADEAVRRGPPKYRADEGEQLWQRNVGNAMPTLAMAWVLSGDRRYLDAARAWALASSSYPTWGQGKRDGHDLAAGHQLFGIALVYDWCYADLDAATRDTLRAALERRGGIMASSIPARHDVLQNHLWVDACGAGAAGLAICDEVPAARAWIAGTLDKWRQTRAALGPDGASHEGAGYWSYGVEYLLKFMWLARELLGVDLYDNVWWRNTADYRLYLGLPRNVLGPQSAIVDLADSPRGGFNYGPDYLLRALAHEYHIGHAQWLAAELDAAGDHSTASPWLNLIWFDPAIVTQPPADLPTLRHFSDMEIVSARSDWSGDESLVVFKCGPFVGHKAVQAFKLDPGGGHVHPDANHFVVFGRGDWLIRDDGYLNKATSQHNTLLIDGHGQMGEGAKWFQGSQALAVKAEPRILRADSTPALDHIVGDATEAYPRASGLKRFVRHLLFLKPDVLIVADDITLDAPRPLELRFHPENQTRRGTAGVFTAVGTNAALRLEALTRHGVEIATGEDATAEPHGKTVPGLFSIRLRTNARFWQNAVALSWSAAKARPAAVHLRQQGDLWTFLCADRTVTLDWKSGEARLGH